MTRIRTFALIVSAVAALLVLPAFAQASGQDVIKDCTYDGHIDGNWTQQDYEDAEQQLNGDNDSYSDCREVIAQGRAGGGSNDSDSGSNGSSGGSGSGGGSGGGSAQGATGGSGSGSSGGSGSGDSGSTLDGRAGSPTPGAGDPNLATPSGAYAPTPEDKAAYDAARKSSTSVPATLAAGSFNQNSMPLPLLIALIASGLVVLVTTVLLARKRLPAAGRGALRLVRR